MVIDLVQLLDVADHIMCFFLTLHAAPRHDAACMLSFDCC